MDKYKELFRAGSDKELTQILIKDLKNNPKNILAMFYLGRLLIDPKYIYGSKVEPKRESDGYQILTILSDIYNYADATCILATRCTNLPYKLHLYCKAANGGNNFACTWLGRYNITKGNIREGLVWLKVAASKKYPDALNELGKYYKKIGDYNNSFIYYNKSRESNNVIGIKNIGKFYRDGKGVKKDLLLAEEYLTEYWMRTREYIRFS